MRCPECEKEGEKSTVIDPMGGATTLMAVHAFWDEEDRHHHHDPNATTTSYSCSRGHKWSVSHRDGCPVKDCEWNERMAGNE